MSGEYTFISDLNSGGGGAPSQGQMTPLPQHMPQYTPGGPPGPQQAVTPMPTHFPLPPPPPRRRSRVYTHDSDDSDSDNSDDDSDSDADANNKCPWNHYYGIATLILLLVILWFTLKIRSATAPIVVTPELVIG